MSFKLFLYYRIHLSDHDLNFFSYFSVITKIIKKYKSRVTQSHSSSNTHGRHSPNHLTTTLSYITSLYISSFSSFFTYDRKIRWVAANFISSQTRWIAAIYFYRNELHDELSSLIFFWASNSMRYNECQ